MQLGISEILEAASKIEDRTERMIYLRKQYTKSLGIVVQYALDPNIEWLISSELPPFNLNKIPGNETMLLAEARRLYLFVKGGNDALTDHKRQVLLIQLLEMLCPGDIAVLQSAIEKKLPFPNLDYDFLFETYPGLLPAKEKEIEEFIFPKRDETNGKSTHITELPKPKKPKKEKPLTEKKTRGAKKALRA